MLVKTEYMSKDNYGLIAAESGILFNWSYILHNRFVMEVSGKDKRKQTGNSKLAPFLGILFEEAKVNNQALQLPSKKIQKSVKAGSGKGKKPINLVLDDEDVPPPKRTKEEVAEREEELKKETGVEDVTVFSEIKSDAAVVNALVQVGFTPQDVQKGVDQNWKSYMEDVSFSKYIARSVPPSPVKVEVATSSKKVLKIPRGKLQFGNKQVSSQGEATASSKQMKNIPFATEFIDVADNFEKNVPMQSGNVAFQGISVPVKADDVLNGLIQAVAFVNQQEMRYKAMGFKEERLQGQIKELKEELKSQFLKNQGYDRLYQDYMMNRSTFKEMNDAKDQMILNLQKEVMKTQLTHYYCFSVG